MLVYDENKKDDFVNVYVQQKKYDYFTWLLVSVQIILVHFKITNRP